MIRINLLPFRAARKKENIRRQVSIYFLSLVLLLTSAGYFHLRFKSKLLALSTEKQRLTKDLDSYEKITKEITRLKKRTKEIQSKLDIIQELQKKRGGAVRLLEKIAVSVPMDKLWLRSLVETDGILTLQGTAMDNDTVALFMTHLEKTEHISSVDLNNTRLEAFPEHKQKAVSFLLTCKTTFFKERLMARPTKSGPKRRR